MSENPPDKVADPQHGNIYWNYFKLANPYVLCLLSLIILFLFLPKGSKLFRFFSFCFFLFYALWLLFSGSMIVELYFGLCYAPVYAVFVFYYLVVAKGGKK